MDPRSGSDPLATDTDVLAAVLHEIDLPVAATDLDGRITHWNHAAEELLGWPAEEAVGRPYAELGMLPADRPLAEALWRPVTGGHPWSGELPFRTREGSRLLAHCRGIPVRDADGRGVGLVTTFIDAQERLLSQQSKGLLDSLFREPPLAIALMDTDLRLARANPVLTRILGTAENAAIGNTFRDLVDDGAAELEALARQVLDTGVPAIDVETWITPRMTADAGSRCWLASFYRLHRSEPAAQTPVGVCCFFAEVTERKEALQAAATLELQLTLLRRANRMSGECEDPLETLRVLVGVAHPDVADRVFLDTLGPDGSLARLASATGPAPGDARLHLPEGNAVRYEPDHPVMRALATQDAVAVGGTCCVPVQARGRLLGVTSFLRAADQPFGPREYAFTGILAAHIGQALDVSRLLGRIHMS